MLIELAQRAKDEGLGPLEKIETNAFWAIDADVVRRRLVELDRAGMVKLTISADPYHQRFVPIERPRLAAVVALEVLGESRVQIRWRDWLEGGFDAGALGEQAWLELLLRYAAAGRDRLCGRAAAEIAPRLPLKNLDAFVDNSCRQTILRSRHVHIDPDGYVMPATCVGLTLGCAKHNAIAEIWRFAELEHSRRPVLSALIEHGPVGLVEPAINETGFVPLNGYADKCHLCWHVRSHLAGKGLFQSELGPIEAYK
jgi:hypothetical protein